MPVLQFKGKTAIECYHHTVPHHTLEFDGKLSVLGKGEKSGLDGDRIPGLPSIPDYLTTASVASEQGSQDCWVVEV